jgi:hypothetical protein
MGATFLIIAARRKTKGRKPVRPMTAPAIVRNKEETADESNLAAAPTSHQTEVPRKETTGSFSHDRSLTFNAKDTLIHHKKSTKRRGTHGS